MAKKCGSGKDKNGRINRSMLHMIYFIWVTFNLVISFRFCIRLLCKSKVNVLMVNIMFIEMVSALDLNTTYSSNHSLYAHLSPYYIRSNIDIQAAATLHIENGVDLIFEGNYAVNVYGAMRISEELFHAIDPQQENGLANSSAFTKIIANNTLTRAGQINIITNSNSSSSFFFNTKFVNMKYAIYVTDTIYTPYVIQNCYFYDIQTAIFENTSVIQYDTILNPLIIQYNLISHSNYGIYLQYNNSAPSRLLISDNTIQECSEYGIYTDTFTGNTNYYRNTFINNENGLVITTLTNDYSTQVDIINNEFIDAHQRQHILYINYVYDLKVEGNDFLNNHGIKEDRQALGITIQYRDNVAVQYNNFINNSFHNQFVGFYRPQKLQFSNNLFKNNFATGNNPVVKETTMISFGKLGPEVNISNNILIENEMPSDNSKLFSIWQPAARCTLNNNTFIGNVMNGVDTCYMFSFICSNSVHCNGLITFEYNNFTNNKLRASSNINSNNLMYFWYTKDLLMQYNIFDNNIQPNGLSTPTTNIIYHDHIYSHSNKMQYNTFHEQHNINSYIYYYDKYSSAAIIVNENDFLSFHNIRYFISYNTNESVGSLACATANYYSTTDYFVIGAKIWDGCDESNSYTGLIQWSPYYTSSDHISTIEYENWCKRANQPILNYDYNTINVSGTVWTNNGNLLGHTIDLNIQSISIETKSDNKCALNAVCFNDPFNSQCARINLDISPSSYHSLSIELYAYQLGIINNRGWIMSQDNIGYDRSIMMHDQRYKPVGEIYGLAMSSGSQYEAHKPLLDNSWSHIIAVWNGVTQKGTLFVNNDSSITVNISNTNGETYLCINDRPSLDHGWHGCLAKISMYPKALSDHEINKLKQNFTAMCSEPTVSPTSVPSLNPSLHPSLLPTKYQNDGESQEISDNKIMLNTTSILTSTVNSKGNVNIFSSVGTETGILLVVLILFCCCILPLAVGLGICYHNTHKDIEKTIDKNTEITDIQPGMAKNNSVKIHVVQDSNEMPNLPPQNTLDLDIIEDSNDDEKKQHTGDLNLEDIASHNSMYENQPQTNTNDAMYDTATQTEGKI
eukprot:331693_1